MKPQVPLYQTGVQPPDRGPAVAGGARDRDRAARGQHTQHFIRFGGAEAEVGSVGRVGDVPGWRRREIANDPGIGDGGGLRRRGGRGLLQQRHLLRGRLSCRQPTAIDPPVLPLVGHAGEPFRPLPGRCQRRPGRDHQQHGIVVARTGAQIEIGGGDRVGGNLARGNRRGWNRVDRRGLRGHRLGRNRFLGQLDRLWRGRGLTAFRQVAGDEVAGHAAHRDAKPRHSVRGGDRSLDDVGRSSFRERREHRGVEAGCLAQQNGLAAGVGDERNRARIERALCENGRSRNKWRRRDSQRDDDDRAEPPRCGSSRG
ncbi:MAG: hypothetical protein K0Q71_2642 [Thermomicrobiales bacterium]|nr:hypothetical protein [Thermomicrobiales bacterium]